MADGGVRRDPPRLRELYRRHGTPHPPANPADAIIVRRIDEGFADRFVKAIEKKKHAGAGWIHIIFASIGGNPQEALKAMRGARLILDPNVNPMVGYGGMVLSAAVFLYIQCDYRIALRGFKMLVRRPAIAAPNVTEGSAESHRAAGNLDYARRLQATIDEEVPIMVRCANGRLSTEEARRLLSRAGGNTWPTAGAAQLLGFVHVDSYLIAPPPYLTSLRQQLPERNIAQGAIRQVCGLNELAYAASSMSHVPQYQKSLNPVLIAQKKELPPGAKTVDTAHLDAVGESHGERLTLSVKDMGACDIYPQRLQHSPNGRLVVACGDSEYIIYTTTALHNKAFGAGLEFVGCIDPNIYAVRESGSVIKLFKNFKEAAALRPDITMEGIDGGPLLAVRSSSSLCFFDWESCRLVQRIEIAAKRSAKMMETLASSSYSSGVHNVSFKSNFLLGNVEKCVEILVESKRIPEASLFANCYCPRQVSRLVALWREKSAQSFSGIGKTV